MHGALRRISKAIAVQVSGEARGMPCHDSGEVCPPFGLSFGLPKPRPPWYTLDQRGHGNGLQRRRSRVSATDVDIRCGGYEDCFALGQRSLLAHPSDHPLCRVCAAARSRWNGARAVFPGVPARGRHPEYRRCSECIQRPSSRLLDRRKSAHLSVFRSSLASARRKHGTS